MAFSKAESIVKCKGIGNHYLLSKALQTAAENVVIFGQYECGTGVNIGEDGLLLTCAHCLGSRPRKGTKKVVIFTTGLICIAVSIAVDAKRDTALLKIIGTIEKDGTVNMSKRYFPFSKIYSGSPLPHRASLTCIGQPGEDDLESEVDQKTNYSVVNISKGRYQGVLGGDLRDNSEIGQLIHDCWTYWGHSGAPLFTSSGEIAGIHSSWDDETGSRHGIHYTALAEFVAPYLQQPQCSEPDESKIALILGQKRTVKRRTSASEAAVGKSKRHRITPSTSER
jgi:hypothetical protein